MRWVAYAQLVRLPNVFTAMADIVLAGAATGAILDHFGTFLCVLVASSLLYMAGMVWNDWFDLKQDLRERPGRPIPSGRISTKNAATFGTVLLIGGLVAAAAADLVEGRSGFSLTLAALLVASILLYDGVLKRTWMGQYAMGACRFFNVLLGISAGVDTIPPWGYALALSIGVYIVGVTWFAKTEARLSKQQTLLTAALVMAGGLLLSLTVPTLALEDSRSSPTPSPIFPYLLAAYGFYVGLKIIPAVRDPRPDRVQPAVRRAILGLVVLDAILATSLVGWPGLAIVLLLAPAMWLGQWLYST
ncbi:MAG: UbiA family prenyltransferase [Planctomycetota bacterium]